MYNSIAYMFIHTAHAYAHTLLQKMDGSKRNILKGTVKDNTPAIPHRVCGDHEFSGTQDSDTGRRSAVGNGLFLFLPLLEIHIPVIPTM